MMGCDGGMRRYSTIGGDSAIIASANLGRGAMSKQKRPSHAENSPKSGGKVPAERIADLAAASRILAAQGVVDGFGHVSMRHPSAPDRYLMARALAPAMVAPKDIIEYDLDSNPCNAAGRPSFLERFIHGEIYRAR